jgi:hypothetical protein
MYIYMLLLCAAAAGWQRALLDLEPDYGAGVILGAFFVSEHAFVFGAVSFGVLSWKKVQLTVLLLRLQGFFYTLHF